jgi:protein-disulfide isomerase
MSSESSPAPRRPISWPLILSIASLAVSGAVWLQMRQEVASLRTNQQRLAADLNAARGTPVIDIAGAPTRGSADAPVTLIEFADYECPYCIRHFTQTMPQIEANDVRTGKVRYVFRDFPIDSLHPGSIRAHEAAHCAIEQQKFWEIHSRLFSAPGTHTDAALDAAASAAGLKMDDFRACLASGRTTAGIRESVAAVTQLGATGTPTFFIGVRDGSPDRIRVIRAIAGAQPYSEFEKAFSAVAAQAQ